MPTVIAMLINRRPLDNDCPSLLKAKRKCIYLTAYSVIQNLQSLSCLFSTAKKKKTGCYVSMFRAFILRCIVEPEENWEECHTMNSCDFFCKCFTC